MDTTQILNEDIDSWETAMFLYNSALKEVGTKFPPALNFVVK